MQLETLYKRTKTGAIVYWKIQVAQGTYPIIDKWSGQLGTTSPLHHSEQVSEGKQKRSPSEQADFMALSDWKRKHDEGYKSLDDFGAHEKGTGGYEDAAGNHIATLQLLLDLALPQFNTDAAGNPKPMLATDISKIKKIDYPVYLQPKLDGVRCLMIVNQNLNQITFLSRSGKEYTSLAHIAKDVVIALWGKHSTWPLIVDGEIYSDELNFQEIVSAVKAYKPNSEKLHFRAYDLVNDSVQQDRVWDVKKLVERDIQSPFIHWVETIHVQNMDEVKAWHDKWVQEGYEGAMIRLFTGKYGQGQRSRDLIKVKEFDETEYPIHSFEYGQRGVEDLIFVCHLKDGGTFKAKMQGTLAQKIAIQEAYEEAYETEKTSKLTVKHFGLTTDGIPRFPVGKVVRDYE